MAYPGFGKSLRSFPKHSSKSKAAALQAAQIETRAKYPHPYYWAGFVLTGDPGATTTQVSWTKIMLIMLLAGGILLITVRRSNRRFLQGF